MSSSVSILLPTGRRRNIKVSPNSTILQTLENLCEREDLNPEEYSFIFQRKILDESSSWRYANVPNNAKLELVKREKSKVETPVRIALQYGDGHRVQGTFQPSQTLMDILSHWENELSPLTFPENHEPSILYVRQEINGSQKLSTTTLKSLGLTSGSAILKLSYKPVTANVETETRVEKSKPTASKTSQKIHPSSSMQSTKQLPFNASASHAAGADFASRFSENSKNSGFITQEMLSSALQQVSDHDMFPKASSSSYSVESMDISIASSSRSSHFGDASEVPMYDDVPKSTHSRPTSANSAEIPRKKVKQTRTSNQQDNQTDFSTFKFPEETAGMSIYNQDDEPELDIAPLMKPCDREEILFDEKEIANQEIDDEDPGDEFFDLTIDDIRRMIAELRSLQNESDEKPLMTARSRELERLRAINQYPKIIIRVAFPNRRILQGFFRPAEKVESLYDFVSQYTTVSRSEFFLFTTPPKVVLKDKNSILYDYHLSPASKVYFGLKNGEFNVNMFSNRCNAISGSLADANLKLGGVFEAKSPSQRKSQSSLDVKVESATPSTSSGHEEQPTHPQPSNHPSGARPKVPKWFKVGKK